MKKILTLMNAITFSSVIVTPVLACSNQKQDSILKAITDGNDKYNGWDPMLVPIGIAKPKGVPTGEKPEEKTLTIEKKPLQDSVAQLLAKLILEQASIKTTPLWFASTLPVGTQCYDFTIDNGTLNNTSGTRTWDVTADTGRISIDITYQLGSVNNDKTFKVEQYIKKTFKVKCFYTCSDYVVYSCVNKITSLAKQLITVNVNEKDKPTIGTGYTDFLQETRTATQAAINLTIDNNAVNINIKGIDGEKVNQKLELKVNLAFSFQDSLIDMALPSPYDGNKYDPTVLQFIVNS